MTDLYYALDRGECDVVDQLLNQSAKQGIVPSPGLITVVCINGNLDLLTRLLKYPMDVQRGLFFAVVNGHSHLLDHLYVAGADVNFIKEDGTTLLHEVRSPGVCGWLLDMGARQVSDENGRFPIYRACFRGNTEVFSLLLSHGAVLTDDLLLCACMDKRTEIIRLILQHPQGPKMVGVTDSNGWNILHHTCFAGKFDIVELLLQHQEGKQALSVTTNDHETPLYLACLKRRTEVVQVLLSTALAEGRQTIDVPNRKWITPLHLACQQGLVEIALLLINCEKGRHCILETDKYGNNCLDIARRRGHHQIVELLTKEQKLVSNS